MRKALFALLLVPALSLADDASKAKAAAPGAPPEAAARIEKKLRMARTIGLAEALDLDAAQALRLGDALNKYDDRRKAARQQEQDAQDLLRRVARGEKASAADVDGAVARLFDARAQLSAIDKESLGLVTKDLAPEQKARAVLFLARFRTNMDRQMMRGHGDGPGMGGGMGAPGMGQGMKDGDCPMGKQGKADCPMGKGDHPEHGIHHRGMMDGSQGALMQRGRGDRMAARLPGSAADDPGYDPPAFVGEEF